MTAQELVLPIEKLAPLASQEGWDNCGFSVGDPCREVTKALVALDCTEDVVSEAVELGCDIIITHHPLIFSGVKSITPADITGRIIEKVIKHNIVVYAAHTNMDKFSGGVSGNMADKLGMIERTALTADGFGMIGELEKPVLFEDFAQLAKERFCLSSVRCSKPYKGEISRVAVCGGSGKSFIKDAMRQRAQVYITGDIPYHDYYCEKGFVVMDIGHYGSEYNIVEVFTKILCENFPTFAVSVSRKNNNPIYYY